MMSRLVTGVYYDYEEAERALDRLSAQSIPKESIYVVTSTQPPDIGRKGGRLEAHAKERRFAGMKMALIIGMTTGFLAGLGVGVLGQAMAQMMMNSTDTATLAKLSPLLASPLLNQPWLTAVSGGLIGFLAGGLIGLAVDYALARLGAIPPPPNRETLVAILCDEDHLGSVSAALIRASARDLNVASRASSA
jgi:hypothetical protein